MSQDSERPKKSDRPARQPRSRARAQLDHDLAAMFDAAAQPPPEELLNLVDQLEAQRAERVSKKD